MHGTRRAIAVRLCLALVSLFQRAPLKRLALRTEHTARYHSTEQYVADRLAELPAYRRLFAPFGSFEGKVVAELGCSLGYLLDGFRRGETFSAIGIDIDPGVLALGREMYGDRITFVQSAPAAIPLPSNSVDVLYSIDTVEHLRPPREIFLECLRILRPGGIFLVHFYPWWGPMGAHLEDIIVVPWAHVLFSMETLLTAAAALYDSPRYVPACYWFDPETGARRPNPYRDHGRWQEYLNRLTVHGFLRLIGELPFEVVHFQKLGFEGKRVPLSRHLSRLAQLPGLDEYVTKAVFCVLQKPAAAAAQDAAAPADGPAAALTGGSWWGIGAGLRQRGERPEAAGAEAAGAR